MGDTVELEEEGNWYYIGERFGTVHFQVQLGDQFNLILEPVEAERMANLLLKHAGKSR